MKWLLSVLGVVLLLAVLCLCSILLGRAQERENPLLRFGLVECDETNCINTLASAPGLPPLTLGELVVEFGEPCSLTLASDRAYVQVDGFVAETLVPRDVALMRHTLLTPRALMTALIFPQDIFCNTPMMFASSRNIYVRWCGFITLGGYIDRCRLPGLVLLPE